MSKAHRDSRRGDERVIGRHALESGFERRGDSALIPIRDINPRHRTPLVNWLLLGTIGAVFLYQVSLGRAVEALLETYAFYPGHLRAALATGDRDAILDVTRTIFTSMFLHGGWFHVLGNVIYLRVFGDNIEGRLGHLGFLAFYLAAGASGALSELAFQPRGDLPMIGASGAIAGVLGAYVVLFPAARIVTLFPVLIMLTFIEVPAILFLGIWALQQLLNSYLALGEGAASIGGVAWFAHLGGFVFGLLWGSILRLRAWRRRRVAA